MKPRWKWVWLFIGMLLISATCGFGFEAKQSRTQFEEAKDAFQRRDWDRVAANLSDSENAPSAKAFSEFMKTYVDPVLETGIYQFNAKESASRMVPIKNETDSYVLKVGGRRPLAMLQYLDDAIWFDVPFSKQKYGMFKGKRVTMPFALTFVRISRTLYPSTDGGSSWKSIPAFARGEKGRLVAMGLTPKCLMSRANAGIDFATEYEARIQKWLASRGT